MKKLLQRLLGRTTAYRFMVWLKETYHHDSLLTYRPEQFREFGEGAYVSDHVSISHPERVVLKARSCIMYGSMINSGGGLYVGENTGIGFNCSIWTGQHRYRDAKSIPFDNVADLRPVIIREFVWIGEGAKILPGVEIGEGAIISMGSVVVKNVPPLAIVLGNPAEVIGYRSKEHYYKCKEEGRFQNIRLENIESQIVPIYKAKYEKELKELGML